MVPIYLIPLLMSCIAVWVSLGNPQWELDDLPKLLATLMGVICMIWFFVATPWLIKLSLILLLLLIGNNALEKNLKTDE